MRLTGETVLECQTPQLMAKFGSAHAVLPGQDEVPLVFTNKSTSTCEMVGFPGFTLVGPESDDSTTYSPIRAGSTIVGPEGDSPTTTSSIPAADVPQPVMLKPRASAFALFTWLASADICDNGVSWVPTEVMSIPPDQTTAFTIPWTNGVVDNCQGAATYPGTFIGAMQAGDDGPPPISHIKAAAQWASKVLYVPLGTFWSSSGVITRGSAFLLAVAAQPQGPGGGQVSVKVYQWTHSRWKLQGSTSITPFGQLALGVGNIKARSLTGPRTPDFQVLGQGADTIYDAIVSDAGGRWHTVSFDEGDAPSPTAYVAGVTGKVIWGEIDLCGCATNQPQADAWFSYSKGEFRPTNPIGPVPPCATTDFDETSSDQPESTFTLAACDDGWALASGTQNGAPVIGLFNWQGTQWTVEDIGDTEDLVNYPPYFTIPLDLLRHLATEIGVSVPSP